MKRHPQRADTEEAALLEHFRRHADAQPSAQLDARILAAARTAATARPAYVRRLARWLFGRPQRWSAALAGVAVLGIGLSLTLRTFEPAPRHVDAALPASAPVPATESLYSVPAQAPAAAAAAAAALAPLAESADLRDASPTAKRKAAPALSLARPALPEPQASLYRLQALQRQGDAQAVRRAREDLRRRFPQLDIERALGELPTAPQ